MKKICSALCFLLLVLSGCSKKNQDAGAVPIEAEKTAKKQIVFYNLFDPEDAVRGQIQAFQSAHKDISIIYKKFQDVEEYEQAVINELAEGRGPDIFAIRNDWLPNYQRKLAPAPPQIMLAPALPSILLTRSLPCKLIDVVPSAFVMTRFSTFEGSA